MIDVKVGQMVYYISDPSKELWYCRVLRVDGNKVWGRWDKDLTKAKTGKLTRSPGYMNKQECYSAFNLPECFKKVIR